MHARLLAWAAGAQLACSSPSIPQSSETQPSPQPTFPTGERSEATPAFRNPDLSPPPPREGKQLAAPELERVFATADEYLRAKNDVKAMGALMSCANRIPASARCEGELGLVLDRMGRRRAEARYYLSQAARTDDADVIRAVARCGHLDNDA